MISVTLQALFAEAEILSKGNPTGNPRMVELIDTIMSIPSCLQDQHSKVQVIHKINLPPNMIMDRTGFDPALERCRNRSNNTFN